MVHKDRAVPKGDILFKPVNDDYGLRLALVFGNHAKGGICPYAQAKRCHHCDIGFGEGIQFDSSMNLRRLHWFKAYYASYWDELAHLLIYNSGSTLNPRELAPDVCDKIVFFAASLPKLRMLSMDSRETFIDTDYIRRLALVLGADKKFGIIIGIESSDDRIRNEYLNKKMSKNMIEKGVARFYKAWSDVTAQQRKKMAEPALLVNIVVGSPGTTHGTAIKDALETATYSMTLAKEYKLPLDLNIHPYYPSQNSLKYFPNHPRASSQVVIDFVKQLKAIKSDNVQFFIGLQDENHDQEPQQRLHQDSTVRQYLREN